MIDTLNLVVRQLVRAAMAMPVKSVRPADQIAPAGGQGDPYATVKIISCDGVGWADISLEDDGSGGTNEVVQLPERFVASVNFYGSSVKDGGGIATYSNDAVDRATRLPRLLQLSVNGDRMRQIGICFLNASSARNLSDLEDATWRSRGQVDLSFMVVNREIASIQTILSVPLSTTVIGPDGIPQTRSSEVTT